MRPDADDKEQEDLLSSSLQIRGLDLMSGRSSLRREARRNDLKCVALPDIAVQVPNSTSAL